MDFESRCLRLRKLMRRNSFPGLLVTSKHNVTYLTGFTGDSSYLWIDDESMFLISDGRFTQQLQEECPNLEVIVRKPSTSILAETTATFKKSKRTSIAIEGDQFSKNAFDRLSSELPSINIIATAGLIEGLREIKDGDEIAAIQRAIELAETGFLKLRNQLQSDSQARTWTEKNVADTLEIEMRRAGAVSSAFPTIVGVGPRAALPHGMPSHKRIDESPFLLIDWGACEGQYVSDLTRVLVTGALSSKMERIYHTVLNAQESAIRAMRPGALMSQIDAVAREAIANEGFEKRFTHGLGHSFGLQIHESIRLAKGQDRPLKAGMVVTVEPGVYVPNVGGVRIEDDVLITRNGCKVLTTLPKDLHGNTIELQ